MRQRRRTLRRPVGRTDGDFIRDVKTRQHLGGAMHNWPVIRASHNNAYYRLFHAAAPYSPTLPYRRESDILLDTLCMQSVASSCALRESFHTAPHAQAHKAKYR